VAQLPVFAHRASAGLVGMVAASASGRAVVESVLRSYYPRARKSGLERLVVPSWYRWLRAYYFAALRTRLPNAEFQRRYWEIGSLTDYQRYISTDAGDVRVVRFLEEIVDCARALASQIPDRPVRVLEIGCGDGLSLKALDAALGSRLKLWGLDISMQGLLLARQTVAEAELIQGSVTRLPFSGRFDLVVSRGVLMFLGADEIQEAFRELRRLGGRLVLTEPANRDGKPVAVETLQHSLKREVLDQTSWIHPYALLAHEQGGVVTRQEHVSGNCLLTVQWPEC